MDIQKYKSLFVKGFNHVKEFTNKSLKDAKNITTKIIQCMTDFAKKGSSNFSAQSLKDLTKKGIQNISDINLKESAKKGYTNFAHYIKVHKTQAIASASIIALLAVGSYAGESYYKSNLVNVYHVYLHGEHIGVVDSPKVVEDWIAQKMDEEYDQFRGYDLQIDSDVTYEHKSVYKGTFDNEAALSILAQSVEVKAKAYKLYVDGEFIGYVRSEEEGQYILEQIISQYTKPYAKKHTVQVATLNDDFEVPVEVFAEDETEDGEKLKSVSIKEEIKFEPTIIEPEEMNDPQTITQILTEGKEEQIVYALQPGDYLGKVAQKFDIPVSELLKLNPGINENTILQIGQELVVTGVDTKVTVQVVTEEKRIESIAFETEYRDDSSMYKGETKTIQKGVKGEKEVTYEVFKENGYEVGRNAINEVVLKEPVKQIVLRGTKAVPKVASGKFIWPTKGGVVTSKYGKRWGKMHNGIDISGVKDKTIMAADSGTVTFAGWKNSFGNLVIIDHGGGVETYYAHLSSISVKKGQKVAQGQKIGVMGTTGRSTGVHLHFEIRVNGKPTDPSKAF